MAPYDIISFLPGFMQQFLKQKQLSVIEQNVSYYDEIAGQYDAILNRDHSNEIIREKVASVFIELIPSGLVMDFGGGTGKDLEWLAGKGYQVIFCEPSVKMREKAILLNKNSLQQNNIVFLENAECDFTIWQTNLPFSQKTDAVLANFAVINNIPDVELLFKNLSLVMRPGGHLLMLVLKSDFKKRWRFNRRATLLSLFTASTVTADIHFNQNRQKVHLYTVRKIKKKADAYFHFHSSRLLKENVFGLIQLIRK